MRLVPLQLLLAALMLTLASVFGCAHQPTAHQRIAYACEAIADGLDAAVVAKQAGRLSAAELQRLVEIARPTAAFCQPPAESLAGADYAALLAAAARLASPR